LIQLKSEKLSNSTKYQYYEYCEGCGYEISTTYNEPVTINGVMYTPHHGAFEIENSATNNVSNRVCDVINKLEDTDRDLSTIFSMVANLKGWLG